MSCGKGQSAGFEDQVSLVGSDTLSFSLDDTTYYVCKTMFQFEDNGKEYLFLQNDRNRGYI